MDRKNLCNSCGLRPQVGTKPVAPCRTKKKCCKKDCCKNDFVFRKVVIPAALGDDKTGKDKPVNGAYTNSYVEYEANGAQYMYDSNGIYTKIGNSTGGAESFNELKDRPKYDDVEMTSDTNIPNVTNAVAGEALLREQADNGLQGQIDAITVSSDVKDIVGTYAELQNYDTSTLGDNDIIKVLQDEDHNDETTYYRWSTSTETFSLIGEEGPYYTKASADQKFQDKLTAGTNISIDPLTNTISTGATIKTVFYANSQETGQNRHIYKDVAMGTAVSAQDILDANDDGQVVLRITTASDPTLFSDAYLQNTYVGPSDYQFLFLDEKAYREYAATATTDTSFYYTYSELQQKLSAGTNISISGNTISATDTTYSDFTGATASTNGTNGLVPAPVAGDEGKFLKGDGTWGTVQGGIPTNATFWGQSYDSVNNVVNGNVSLAPGVSSAVPRYIYGKDANNTCARLEFNSQNANNNQLFLRAGAINTNACYIAMGINGSSFGNDIHIVSSTAIRMYAHLFMNDKKIVGLADPTAAQHAATKNYVDSFYPVGTVYTSTSSTAPTFAGGTWTQIGTQTIGSSTVYYYERTA